VTIGLRQADKRLYQKPNLFTLFKLIIGLRNHLRVVGDSMEPTLLEGNLIIYKKNNLHNLQLDIGDIVVAIHPKIKRKLIIKRINNIIKDKYDLRGDNYLSSTDSRHWGLIEFNQLVGKVEKIITN
tara:strand:+ start:376 stop:753 length:378 start_codon:yes stop_codon:yes gene_type:complete